MSRLVTAPNHVREYETIYILRPDVDADAAEAIGSRIVEVMKTENGKLTKVETWGRRRLAYEIAKHRRGVYIYLKYLGGGTLVAELERNLRLNDSVIKFQTVLMRNNVPVAAEVAADDVRFERIEAATDNVVETREMRLGLIPRADEPRRSLTDDLDGFDGFDDDFES